MKCYRWSTVSSGRRAESPRERGGPRGRLLVVELALATLIAVVPALQHVQARTQADGPDGAETAGDTALPQPVSTDISGSERLARMVRDHLESLRGSTWSRFDIVGVRWVNGEPPEGATFGPLHGTAEPTANGTLLLYADVATPAGRPLRLPVQATVRPWVRVPVATKDLRKGDSLDSGNVRMEERALADLKGAHPADPNVASGGMKAKHDFEAGEVLTATSVEVPFLVRASEKVEIRYRDGGIRLTTKGIARRAGRAGETITVENANTKRMILASVVAAGTVEVRP